MANSTEFPYLHGFSEVEQARLVRQARIAESTIFHDIDYSGARRLLDMAANTAAVVGIELLAAAQGIEFRRPLTSSPELEQAYAIVREAGVAYTEDRYFAPDIARATEGVRAGRYRAFAGDLLPSA